MGAHSLLGGDSWKHGEGVQKRKKRKGALKSELLLWKLEFSPTGDHLRDHRNTFRIVPPMV